MTEGKRIMVPVGEENFEKIRTNGFYYVDKTGIISELVQDPCTVRLITRPRRFGKTLVMSMLKNFFDIRRDSRQIFQGLAAAADKELCGEWMNRWPLLFLSFKDIWGCSFSDACTQLAFNISSLCVEHAYLLDSVKVNGADKKSFARLMDRKAEAVEVRNSLYLLTRMLYMHFGRQAILLLDEYDVPLGKAHENGYYTKMLDVVRGVMSSAFKTNDYLKFAVVTGCLRIAKESIFTGVNHFGVNSIYEGGYMDGFGFTEREVLKLLNDAGLTAHAGSMKTWYDGYRFGDQEIYCPWDVVSHVTALSRNCDRDHDLRPGNYWKDTSHNGIIRSFIGRKDIHVKDQFETLLAGGSVRTRIREVLTYDLEQASEEDFWSILYMTGYLTSVKPGDMEESLEEGEICLRIPNEEIKTIFAETIVSWFQDTLKTADRSRLFAAWWQGKEDLLTELVTDILFQTISYFDYREDYYHAFMAGLFAGAGFQVVSNREMGTGRPDIVVKDRENRRAIIIEVKHSVSEKQMERDCRKALEQIDAKQYAVQFLKGYRSILCYGAAFYEKSCLIRKRELSGPGLGV